MSDSKVDKLRSKVESLLRERGQVYQILPDKTVLIRHGSTAVSVRCAEFGDNTVVRLLAPVATGLEDITPELTLFLAEQNNDLIFGKFSLDTKANAVWYEYALLGDQLDAEELYSALAAVVLTADKYDEEVCSLTGGKRFADV